MDAKKDMLLRTAARLYSLGIDLEGKKEQIRKMVTDGVSYESPEMAKAVSEYSELKELWDSLEQDYLSLKNELT